MPAANRRYTNAFFMRKRQPVRVKPTPSGQSPGTLALLQPGWRGHLPALLAGLALPLSLAPFDIWPLSLICPALLAWTLQRLNGRQALQRSFWFGLGMYGTGASWVIVSISGFGGASLPLALLLTGIFILFLAAVFSLPF